MIIGIVLRFLSIVAVFVLGIIVLSFVKWWAVLLFVLAFPVILFVFKKQVAEFIMPDMVNTAFDIAKKAYRNRKVIKAKTKRVISSFRQYPQTKNINESK